MKCSVAYQQYPFWCLAVVASGAHSTKEYFLDMTCLCPQLWSNFYLPTVNKWRSDVVGTSNKRTALAKRKVCVLVSL